MAVNMLNLHATVACDVHVVSITDEFKLVDEVIFEDEWHREGYDEAIQIQC